MCCVENVLKMFLNKLCKNQAFVGHKANCLQKFNKPMEKLLGFLLKEPVCADFWVGPQNSVIPTALYRRRF